MSIADLPSPITINALATGPYPASLPVVITANKVNNTMCVTVSGVESATTVTTQVLTITLASPLPSIPTNLHFPVVVYSTNLLNNQDAIGFGIINAAGTIITITCIGSTFFGVSGYRKFCVSYNLN